MSPAKAPRPCPYCDHVSPPDSKFCNECGAALHLQPCPHCGSVNDITKSSICGRCNGDLNLLPPDTQPSEETPDSSSTQEAPSSIAAIEAEARQEPQGAAVAEAASASGAFQAHRDPLAMHDLPVQRRSPALLIGVLALLAGAGYFGYQAWKSPAGSQASTSSTPAQNKSQGKTVEASPLPALQPPSAGRASSEIDTPAAEIKAETATNNAAVEASNTVATPTSKPETPAASSPRLATQARPSPRQAARPEPAANAEEPTPAFSSRQRNEAQQGLDLKKPQISNCTDAVAALGLCTQETKPGAPR